MYKGIRPINEEKILQLAKLLGPGRANHNLYSIRSQYGLYVVLCNGRRDVRTELLKRLRINPYDLGNVVIKILE